MSENVYQNYNWTHRTFGGRIYNSDFNRKFTLAEIAQRIASDKKFDRQCRLNQENKLLMSGSGQALTKSDKEEAWHNHKKH